MASPSVTYTFSNGTSADASQVNTNFTDVINGITDGTKDLNISALTCAGAVAMNGAVTLGNASGDAITVTGTLTANAAVSLDNAVTINDSGADVDFRVESDTSEYGIVMDGTNGHLGFNTNYSSSYGSYFYHNESGKTAVAIIQANSGSNGLLVRTAGTAALSSLLVQSNNGSDQLLNILDNGSTTINGNTGIGVAGASPYRLRVKGATSDSSTIAFSVHDSSNLSMLDLTSDGGINVPRLLASADVLTAANKNLTTSSDMRMKNDRGLVADAISTVKGLTPRYFSWKSDENDVQQLGFYSQEVHAVLPEAAPKEDIKDAEGNIVDTMWGLNTRAIVATAIKAIQEQQIQIDSLKAEIEALEA